MATYEVDGGQMVAMSHPREVADRLGAYRLEAYGALPRVLLPMRCMR
jgi:hypothetical protein